MRTRTLGRTGIEVSVLGFGCSPLGGVFGEIDEAEGIRAVALALKEGIRYFDVAPFYGHTRAEAVLGRALAGVPREAYVLSTKVGRYGETEFDFSAHRVKQSLAESLSRLRVQYADIVLVHDVEFGSLEQVVEETLPALREAKQQGIARAIGISGLPLASLHWIVERAEVDVILSYCHLNLNDTALVSLLPLLSERGIGVIHAAPLGMGLLTRAGPPPWHPAPEPIRAACRAAVELAAEHGRDLAEVALRFCVGHGGADTTLVGMRSTAEVRANLTALGKPLDPALLQAIATVLDPIRDLTWPSGRQG